MDGVLALVLFATLVALPLVLLDTAALRWGADSREPMADDHRR